MGDIFQTVQGFEARQVVADHVMDAPGGEPVVALVGADTLPVLTAGVSFQAADHADDRRDLSAGADDGLDGELLHGAKGRPEATDARVALGDGLLVELGEVVDFFAQVVESRQVRPVDEVRRITRSDDSIPLVAECVGVQPQADQAVDVRRSPFLPFLRHNAVDAVLLRHPAAQAIPMLMHDSSVAGEFVGIGQCELLGQTQDATGGGDQIPPGVIRVAGHRAALGP